MIKFFRRIRQQLLAENPPAGRAGKFSKYLIYAIGEIILVVIGILIALQINTWNSTKIAVKKERNILKELSVGLKLDRSILENALNNDTDDLKDLYRLDTLLNDPEHEYTPDIDELFGKVYGYRFERVNTAFYEDLKASGFQVLKDDKIKSAVVNLFENNYEVLKDQITLERSVNQVNRPYFLQNFTDLTFKEHAKPKDFNAIWRDSYFKNIVHYRIITMENNQIKWYEKTIEDIDTLLSEIAVYLDE